MKITEKRLREIIVEEKENLSDNLEIRESFKGALQNVAIQAAMLHDGVNTISKIPSADLKKINMLAENLDDIFYRLTSRNPDFFKGS